MQKRYGSKRRAKEELFARHANFIYLGNERYGFAAASQFNFDNPIQTFTEDDADEAALLAGITKSPSEYAPTVTGNEKALRRRNQILMLVVANHFLTAERALAWPASSHTPGGAGSRIGRSVRRSSKCPRGTEKR
jgi:membrane carboxypeptidase/penicillin-binding protein